MIKPQIKSTHQILILLFLSSLLTAQEIDSTFKKSIDTITDIYRIDSEKAIRMADSIIAKALPQEAKYEEDLATVYRQKAAIYGASNIDSQKHYIHKSLEVSKRYKNWKQYLMTTSNMAGNYGRQGEFEKSDSLFQFILNHPEFDHGDKNKIVLLLQYSIVLNDWQKYDQSIALLNEAMEISNQMNFHKYDMHIYNQSANHYSQQGEPKKAITYQRKILHLLKPGDTRVYTTYNNMANQFLRLSEIDSAKQYISKVINGKPKESSLIYTYQTASNLAYLDKNYELGIEYSSKCVDISRKFKRWSGECKCNFLKARNIYKLQNYSLTKNILNSTRDCINDMNEKHQLEFKELEFGTELQFINRADLEQEFLDILKFQDSLTSNSTAEKFRELDAKFQTQQKEAENQVLKKDKLLAQAQISKQRSYLFAAGIGILSLLITLWNLFKTAKERKKNLEVVKEKNKAITSLNKEINHRTKNHLALATALLSRDKIQSSDPKVVKALSENENRMRTLSLINQKLNIDQDQTKVNIQEYLTELGEDLLFGFSTQSSDQASFNFSCDSIELDSELCLRLGLITNELITNSLKHAKPKSQLELKLSLEDKGEKIKLLYSDNGKIAETKIPSSQDSLGLKLIDDLMKQIHAIYEMSFKEGFKLNAEIAKT